MRDKETLRLGASLDQTPPRVVVRDQSRQGIPCVSPWSLEYYSVSNHDEEYCWNEGDPRPGVSETCESTKRVGMAVAGTLG